MKILINRHFVNLGPALYRVLAAQRQGYHGCHPAHCCLVSSVLFLLSGKACLCSVTIYMRNCSWSSSSVTSRLYSCISPTPRSAVSFTTWIPCTKFRPSDSLVDHSMSQGPLVETFDPFSFLGRSGGCFLL